MKIVTSALILVLAFAGLSAGSAAYADDVAPAVTCPDGYAPGILDDDGNPQGCVNIMPCLNSQGESSLFVLGTLCPVDKRSDLRVYRVSPQKVRIVDADGRFFTTIIHRHGKYAIIINGHHVKPKHLSLRAAKADLIDRLTFS
jgi:hypothetical protein